MNNLAPPSLFIGGTDQKITALLAGFQIAEFDFWKTLLTIAAVWTLIAIFTYLAWWWYVEKHDQRSSYERWLDQKADDEEQARYLDEYAKRKRGPFSAADRVFLRRMMEFVPDEGTGQKMMFLESGELKKSARVRRGGFVFVRGPYGPVSEYFLSHGWERLPFYYRDRQIFRKR